MNDLVRATSMMMSLSADTDCVRSLVIEGAPVSKARPRFGKRGRVYSPKEMRAAEIRTGWYLKRMFKVPMEGNVAIACIFFRPNRQRIDADNMLKHICDAANGIVWHDDSQVTAIMGIVEFDAEWPRTLVAVSSHSSSLQRGSAASYPCALCGEPINYDNNVNKRRFCSKKCRYEAQKAPLLPNKTCVQCGNEFHPHTRTRKLCSAACRIEWMTKRNWTKAKPYSRCLDCGKELSHHRGGRCRACWLVQHRKD